MYKNVIFFHFFHFYQNSSGATTPGEKHKSEVLFSIGLTSFLHSETRRLPRMWGPPSGEGEVSCTFFEISKKLDKTRHKSGTFAC